MVTILWILNLTELQNHWKKFGRIILGALSLFMLVEVTFFVHCMCNVQWASFSFQFVEPDRKFVENY